MAGRVFVKGLEKVVMNMNEALKDIDREVEGAARTAADLLEKKVKERISLTCHSLRDLARMGHPYRKGAPDDVPHRDDFVHQQSGKLISNVEKIVTNKNNRITGAVGVDEKKVKYIKYLTYGTSRMRVRDPLGHVWQENKETVLKIIKYGVEAGVGSRRGRTGR
jgi:HK97 gp10 family phage protein